MSNVAPQCGEWKAFQAAFSKHGPPAVNRNDRLITKQRDYIRFGSHLSPWRALRPARRRVTQPPMPFGITLESLICEMDRFSCVACRGDFVPWQFATMIFISL